MNDKLDAPTLELEMANFKSDLKEKVMLKLKGHDWINQMRLKVSGFIHASGTKNISTSEIFDFVQEGAYNSFPQNIKDELTEETNIFINRIGHLTSLGITAESDDSEQDK